MAVRPSLLAQTSYAELLERSANAAFDDAFLADGGFVSKAVRGRRYWYFQSEQAGARSQKYVGPETPELLDRIARHKETKDDVRERRAIVSSLVRSYHLPRPPSEIGDVLEALAEAGVFRLRAVLVGTTAYQSYPAMLGASLPAAILRTGDIDIAQFRTVSVAVEDKTAPMLDILRNVDRTFRPVPHGSHRRRVTSYAAKDGLRVDFLTPNEGRDTSAPQNLPALQTDAQPLRFLDYLIQNPEPAVVLHNAGIYVRVPAPERFAIHKLIVMQRRSVGTAKRDKDALQSEALLHILARKRLHELGVAWIEARKRGTAWRNTLDQSVAQLDPAVRDLLGKMPRS